MRQTGNADHADVGSRIDFLMKVTGMRNAQLARALNFDASYISRVRAGKRGLPPDQPFIEPASDFFARNVRETYQREVLAHELGAKGGWPDDRAKAARLIAVWIEGEGGGSGPSTAGAPKADKGSASIMPPIVTAGSYAEARLFFGDVGRREAALAFLGRIADAGVPCELLLQSDEDTAWMYEDAVFARMWAGLMSRLAEVGCTFTVVHTVSRAGNEMWEGVREWLPLYLMGAVRPYYYPRLRDGVRTRSLFVARERSALVSSSVQGMEGDELCIMLDDADAISALGREFDAYLRLCHPLAQIEHLQSRADLDVIFKGFCSSGPAVAAELSGAVVCARAGQGAIVASPGEHPTVYRIAEPRLADAIAGFIDNLPGRATNPMDVDALLDKHAR